MKEHRWSGWPGAWCLDCGKEDQMEICLAEHSISLMCIHGHVQCEEDHPMQVCGEHRNGPCPCNLPWCDPYLSAAEYDAAADRVAAMTDAEILAEANGRGVAIVDAAANLRAFLLEAVETAKRGKYQGTE